MTEHGPEATDVATPSEETGEPTEELAHVPDEDKPEPEPTEEAEPTEEPTVGRRPDFVSEEPDPE